MTYEPFERNLTDQSKMASLNTLSRELGIPRKLLVEWLQASGILTPDRLPTPEIQRTDKVKRVKDVRSYWVYDREWLVGEVKRVISAIQPQQAR